VREVAAVLAIAAAMASCGPERWSFDSSDPSDASRGEIGDGATSEAGEDGAESEAEGSAVIATEGGASDASDAEARPDVLSCLADGDCPVDSPTCDLSGGRCLRCTGAPDCQRPAGGQVCNVSSGACVQCTLDSDCAATPDLPRCYTTTDTCVRCLINSDCGRESTCQVASHTCLQQML
jgi:hypothetical protein